MKVTQVKTLTKQKVQIELDGEAAFVLYKGEAYRYGIVQEHELSEDVYQELVQEVLTKRAKLRAMHLLEKMDRTKAGLRQKLEQSGYPKEAVEAALVYVEQFHYVDDARYAEQYIRSQKNKKGRTRLKMELLQKGVPQDLVGQALEDLEEELDAKEAIRELLKKKRSKEGPLEEKEKQKLYGFFMRRGFASSDILSVFREIER